MNVVNKVKAFVKAECEKPTSKYGFEPFKYHFTPMVSYAEGLADKLGGDKEVVIIASWLHDIGSITDGRSNHHLVGAKIAENILRQLNYPQDKINLVKKCILNHRGSIKNERVSIEEKIVAEADVMSNFDNIAGIFKAAFIYEKLDQNDAKIAVRKKLQNKWKQLHFAESKKIIKPRYDAAMILLS